jgi:hypothetical protein
MTFEEILEIPPYSLDKNEKTKLLTDRLLELIQKHREGCVEYNRILESIGYDKNKVKSYKDLPFLPVRLFKELSLKSVDDGEVVKTMTSSGTSGQKTSKIYLDRVTSSNQQKAMVKIVNEFTGSSRMPMVILDCPSVVKDRSMFSARGAGILGFSIFGSKKIYALDDDMKLDVEGLSHFLEVYRGQTVLLFGFTFMVWQYFYKELVRLKGEGITFDLSNGVLIHGGGWKKLVSEAVSPEEFHDSLKSVCGLDRIHDYYGMVEQTGCIYMQCECGHLHASIFSDVIARRPEDFSECEIGERGILQVVSTIPESYPGHSLLTEDEGVILGEDDCPCGRKGKYFNVLGRLKNAEIRGCSDTYATEHSAKISNVGEKIKFIVGNSDILSNMPNVAPRKAFDDEVVEFLNDLSKELMRDKNAKSFADVVSFGFWIRKASINNLKKHFIIDDVNMHIGRGTAFHIAPSNVAVNYAYSLVAGLLCGNTNIVRISSKDFPQVGVVNNAIVSVLERYPNMKDYICIVRYDRNSKVNDWISNMCDVRVIWGGDLSITEIRKSKLKPRATEITFADRYSLAVIDSDFYMASNNEDKIVQDFYNDTYLNDQNACTSPRVVVWIGNRKDEAKKLFWNKLHELVEKQYKFQPIMAVDKLAQAYQTVTSTDNMGEIKIVTTDDNLLVRVSVSRLVANLMNYRGNSGYFYEYDCDNILELRNFCNDTHCQTIGVIGNKEIARPLVMSGIKGVDRVVMLGHMMDFDLNWDGYNLVESLTRTVVM